MLIHLLPGNLCVVVLQTGAAVPGACAKFYASTGLNRALPVQYWTWVNHLLHGNFGISYISGNSIGGDIKAALPVDGELILLSQILAFAAAIPLAMIAARKPNGRLDRFMSAGSFFLLSAPGYVLIVLLLWFVADYLALPNTGVASYTSWGTDWVVNLESMAVPAFVVAIGSSVIYFRVLRSDLIATYQEEYITMARSKGISRRRIKWRHAMRPSSIALLGTAGVNIGGLVGGLVIVEVLTGIPGMGNMLILDINKSDYLEIQAIVVVIATIVVALNFLVDLSFGFVDPRISRE